MIERLTRTGPSPYRVEFDWAPAHELCVSLRAFMARRLHKILDLGPSWLSSARKTLTPGLAAELASLKGTVEEGVLGVPALLIRFCPGPRDAVSFLDWLTALSAGEVYELLASRLPEGTSVPPNLAQLRDRGVRVLREWNDCYFKHLDPIVLDGLQTNARSWSARVAETPAADLVEQATNGIRVAAHPHLELISLVPQYHFRPVNLYDPYGTMVTYLYPVDAVPPEAGDPPPALLRTTRALADESRLRILHYLTSGPRTFSEVVAASGLAKSTVHHHLVVLRAAGLLRVYHTPEAGDRYSLRRAALDSIRGDLGDYLSAEAPVG